MFGSNIRTSQTRVCSPIVSYRIRLHELAWKKIEIMLLAERLRKALILNQGCIAVKNLFEFSIKVKFFRTTAREVKDKFF